MNKSSADLCPKSLFNRALPVRSSNLCLHRPVRHTRLPKGAEKNQTTQQWRETGGIIKEEGEECGTVRYEAEKGRSLSLPSHLMLLSISCLGLEVAKAAEEPD